jgi:hypothetical protein
VSFFICANCSGRIRKSKNADIWLHSDDQWMCYPRTHAEPLGLEDEGTATPATDEGRKGLVGEDRFYNQYIDKYDANPMEGEDG